MRASSRLHALGLAVICAGAMACKGGGGGSPTTPGNLPTNPGTQSSVCRTGASSQRSVQTFTADGVTVTSDTGCTVAGSNITCNSDFVDSRFGPGKISQTTRFASRSDIIDEIATNPPRPLASSTTTVTTVSGVSFTTTATNAYDAQRRLTSTAVVTDAPPLTVTTTFSAWDASGRPTTGTMNIPNVGQVGVSNTYDNVNHTVRRDTGLNVCTQTHDANGNIIKETCTGTSPSTTDVTIRETQQICR